MDYSKCWLDYQPVDTVEKEWLTYFQSCEGEIVESAVSEYKLAMEKHGRKSSSASNKRRGRSGIFRGFIHKRRKRRIYYHKR